MAGYRNPGYLPHHHVILTKNSELLRTTLADGIKNIAHNLNGRFVLNDHQLNAVLKTAPQQPDDGVFELIKILKGSSVVNFEKFIECLKDLGYLGLVQELTENTTPQIETRPSPSTSSSIDTGSALSLQIVTQPSPSTSTDTGSALVSQTETLHGNTRTEIRVSIIGKTGVGKSALGNALLQHDTFKSQQKTTSVTSECGSGQRHLQLNGVNTLLKVVDTPGLFDTGNSNKTIAKEIVKCINLLSPGPHLFIIVFRIDLRLSQEDIQVLEYFKNTFGELIDKFAVVVFTGKDLLVDRREVDALDEFHTQLSTLSDVFKHCPTATINNGRQDKTEEKIKDVDRILQLLQTTIHNNGGHFYKNEMYEEAKKLFETRIQDQEDINQNRLAESAKLTKQIEHLKQREEQFKQREEQREEQQKQRAEQQKQRENNLRNWELALKRKEDGLSYTEQVTTSAYQYVEYQESPPPAKRKKIIPRRGNGMISPEDNNTVIPYHTDQTYGEISDPSQGNHLIREMCDRPHYHVSHSGVGNRSETCNGEVDVVKVKIKKAHSTLILSKKKPDYQKVQIKEETLSTCRRNVKNIANCVLYENQESVFINELEDEHEEEDRVKTSELNTRPASQVGLDADDSPRDITVDMTDDQKAGKDDVVSPLVVKKEPEDETYGAPEPTLPPLISRQDIVYNDDQDMKTLLTPGHYSPNLESCLQSTSQHQDPGSGQPSTSSCLDSSHINQLEDDTTPVKTSPVYDDDTTPVKTSPVYDGDKVIRPVDKYTLFKVCEHGTLDELKSILSDKTIDINSTYGVHKTVMYYCIRSDIQPVDRTAMYHCIISSIQPVEKLDLLTSSGAKLGVKDRWGNSLLHVACEDGCVETVEWLLNTGMVDIESKNYNGETAIFKAIRSHKQPVEKVNLLISCAKLDVKDLFGDNSLLNVACQCGCVEIVELLLNTGKVDIESKDRRGKTPILVAIRSGKQPVEKVKLLANFGANLNVKDVDGDSVLHVACEDGSVEIVELLLNTGRVDIESKDSNGDTPIFVAIRSREQPVEKMRVLANFGANLNVKISNPNVSHWYWSRYGYSGDSLLHVLCTFHKVEDVEFLLSKNIDIEIRNKANLTPIISALLSSTQSIQKVELLLDKGAQLDQSSSILHYACEYGNLGCVKYFIKKKLFDIESRDDNNRTPLFNCILTKRTQFKNRIEFLMSMNVNKMVRDKNNLSVLQFARQHVRKTRVQYLIENGFTD